MEKSRKKAKITRQKYGLHYSGSFFIIPRVNVIKLEEYDMFARKNTVLLVIDIQESFLSQIPDSADLVKNALIMIESCKIINLPVIVTEQYPEGIGPTAAALAPSLEQYEKIPKRTFSCCREPRFMKALKATGRNQVIIIGTETHVCIFQTAVDLLIRGPGRRGCGRLAENHR
jgi:nicotinamidase-related amidase